MTHSFNVDEEPPNKRQKLSSLAVEGLEKQEEEAVTLEELDFAQSLNDALPIDLFVNDENGDSEAPSTSGTFNNSLDSGQPSKVEATSDLKTLKGKNISSQPETGSSNVGSEMDRISSSFDSSKESKEKTTQEISETKPPTKTPKSYSKPSPSVSSAALTKPNSTAKPIKTPPAIPAKVKKESKAAASVKSNKTSKPPPKPSNYKPQSQSILGGGSNTNMPSDLSPNAFLKTTNDSASLMAGMSPMSNISTGISHSDPNSAQYQQFARRRQIQQQLLALIHAHKCTNNECSQMPHCALMKQILRHITQCKLGKACKEPHCVSSRQIIGHFGECKNPACGICVPIKRAQLQQQQMQLQQSGSLNLTQPIPGIQNVNQPMLNNSALNGSIPNVVMPPLMGQSPNSPGYSNMHAALGNLNKSPVLANLDAAGGAIDQLNPLHRQKLVQRLIDSLRECLPTDDYNEEKLLDLASKIESAVFQASKTQSQYYHLLAEKIYKLKKAQENLQSRAGTSSFSTPKTSSSSLPQSQMEAMIRMRQQAQLQQNAGSQIFSASNQSLGLNLDIKQETPDSKNSTPSRLGSNPLHGNSGIQDSLGLLSSDSKMKVSNQAVLLAKKQQEILMKMKKSGMGLPGSFDPGTPTQQLPKTIESNIMLQQSRLLTGTVDSPKTSSDQPKKSASKLKREKPSDTFKPKQLKEKLEKILTSLVNHPESYPFLEPVDPVQLNIPDYFEIIKNPMDFSTIRIKIESGEYKDPLTFVEDVRLVFSNAQLYNRKTSRVYRMASNISKVFEEQADTFMVQFGYCCSLKKLYCAPLVIYCSGKCLSAIPRDSLYYSYENRIHFDPKCWKDYEGDAICLDTEPKPILKDKFQEMKNDHVELEAVIECEDCCRKFHEVCVMYNKYQEKKFYCHNCCKLNKHTREPPCQSSKLPSTKLSNFIEEYVNSNLKGKYDTDGKPVQPITLRVVSIKERQAEVKDRMQNRYGSDYPKSFPYKNKAMFAFQYIDGVEVCFFGMHVQEYGSNCPLPNKHRVYIGYLDSVFYFKPSNYRTQVYHDILISYMKFCKMLGFRSAHIWACPPSPGDDYIFYCHPAEQKVPKPKRLQEWYRAMLLRAKEANVIEEFTDILTGNINEGVTSAKQLPYFDGDYWPGVIEDFIKEIKEEEEKLNSSTPGDSLSTKNSKKGAQKGNSKKGKKAGKGGSKKPLLERQNSELAEKLYGTIEKAKDGFFMVKFQDKWVDEIKDPDPCMNCELMEGREGFLDLARENHYQFDTLRRAKHASAMFLYHLHNQDDAPGFEYTCNTCQRNISSVETRWHCTHASCEDFDLCGKCFLKRNHDTSHVFVQNGLVEIDESDSAQMGPGEQNDGHPRSKLEMRQLSVQRCIQALVHACQCQDPNCESQSCAKMKSVVTHTQTCPTKAQKGCSTCRQLVALCCYHAKHCVQSPCSVPYCSGIKQRLANRAQQQRNQQAAMQQRRMAMQRMVQTGQLPVVSSGTTPADESSVVPQPSPSLSTSLPASVSSKAQFAPSPSSLKTSSQASANGSSNLMNPQISPSLSPMPGSPSVLSSQMNPNLVLPSNANLSPQQLQLLQQQRQINMQMKLRAQQSIQALLIRNNQLFATMTPQQLSTKRAQLLHQFQELQKKFEAQKQLGAKLVSDQNLQKLNLQQTMNQSASMDPQQLMASQRQMNSLHIQQRQHLVNQQRALQLQLQQLQVTIQQIGAILSNPSSKNPPIIPLATPSTPSTVPSLIPASVDLSMPNQVSSSGSLLGTETASASSAVDAALQPALLGSLPAQSPGNFSFRDETALMQDASKPLSDLPPSSALPTQPTSPSISIPPNKPSSPGNTDFTYNQQQQLTKLADEL